MKRLLTLVTLLAAALSAADITGNWKGTAEGPNGTIERTFVFKQDGATLTGETVSQFTGKSTITEGKVEGNNVTFTIVANFQGNDMKLTYKGTVESDDQIKFEVSIPDGEGPRIQYVAKRIK